MRMIARACPVCETAAAARLLTAENIDEGRLGRSAFASRKIPEYMHYRLNECQTCDVVYADPIPAADELGAAYRDANFDSGEAARCAARTYGRLLKSLSLPDKSSAIDIGTGDGAFIKELLAFGFEDVLGLEPSTEAIESAAPNIRLYIRHGLFTSTIVAAESQSLITCLQTIEHVPDPLALCREAMKLLKPGGALLIACHNRCSVVNRLLGMRSPIIDIEHLQLFSPRSARRLLEKAGFANVSIRSYVNRYPLNYWMRLFPIQGKVKSIAISLTEKSAVGRIRLPTPAGNMAVVGYRPMQWRSKGD